MVFLVSSFFSPIKNKSQSITDDSFWDKEDCIPKNKNSLKKQ